MLTKSLVTFLFGICRNGVHVQIVLPFSKLSHAFVFINTGEIESSHLDMTNMFVSELTFILSNLKKRKRNRHGMIYMHYMHKYV